MPTIPENDKIPVSDEEGEFIIKIGKTVAGADLVVVPTSAGLYKIECKGEGAAPKICEQTFTSLPFARRALRAYQEANKVALYRKRRVEEIVEARKNKDK
jgi:hypothetical protein